jgi:Cellulase (glycosyl hydrolase family 5)
MGTGERRLADWSSVVGTPLLIVALVCWVAHLHISSPPPLKQVSYAVTPTAAINTSSTAVGLADPDLIGMSEEDVATTLDALRALGVNQVWIFVPWAAVEFFKDRYVWDDVDQVVDAASERGMAVLAAVTSTPRWASDRLGVNSAPRSEDDYAEFVTELAKRYGAEKNGGTATIDGYENWNEPNGAPGWFPSPDTEAYTRLLKAAYTAIKKVDSSTLVVAAGLVAKLSAPAPDAGTALVPDHVADAHAPALEPAPREPTTASAAQVTDVTASQPAAETTAPSTQPSPEESVDENEPDAGSVADDEGAASSAIGSSASGSATWPQGGLPRDVRPVAWCARTSWLGGRGEIRGKSGLHRAG